MARVARIIAEGHPHHITQRGNRRQRTFFGDEDYAAYLHLMAEWCKKCDIAVWAVTDWPTFLSDEEEAAELDLLRRHARTGRPLGDPGFVARLETMLGRNLLPGKAGRPRKKEK